MYKYRKKLFVMKIECCTRKHEAVVQFLIIRLFGNLMALSEQDTITMVEYICFANC